VFWFPISQVVSEDTQQDHDPLVNGIEVLGDYPYFQRR
jgi:hypothetical protein